MTRPDLHCQRLALAAAWETDCPGISRAPAKKLSPHITGGKRYVEWIETCRISRIFPIHRVSPDVTPLLRQAQKSGGDAPGSLCSMVAILQQQDCHMSNTWHRPGGRGEAPTHNGSFNQTQKIFAYPTALVVATLMSFSFYSVAGTLTSLRKLHREAFIFSCLLQSCPDLDTLIQYARLGQPPLGPVELQASVRAGHSHHVYVLASVRQAM